MINYIILNYNINIGIVYYARLAPLMLGNSILSILMIDSGLYAQYPEFRTKPIFYAQVCFQWKNTSINSLTDPVLILSHLIRVLWSHCHLKHIMLKFHIVPVLKHCESPDLPRYAKRSVNISSFMDWLRILGPIFPKLIVPQQHCDRCTNEFIYFAKRKLSNSRFIENYIGRSK